MNGTDRSEIRRYFAATWRKHRQGETLSPLEHIIATTIDIHPEYHEFLSDEQTAISAEFGAADTNPFLHMGMHIAMQEQLGADHPAGIRDLYQKIANRLGDAHTAEHRMMECLGRVLHDAGPGAEPDQETYRECLRRLATG